jgi:hypothetical protein
MSDNFTFWLVLAVAISAVALAAQAICLLLLYRAFAEMQKRVTLFMPRAETMVDNAERTIAESRRDIQTTTAKANQVLDIAHSQLKQIDSFVGETTARGRAQMDRVEMVLDDSLGRVQHTVELFTDTANRPVRELNAVTAGLKAAIGAFFHRQRREPAPDRQEDHEPVGL